MELVSVAVPVLDGGPRLGEVLAAVRAQRLDRPVELVVVDSGSTDGSVALARSHGATVVEIPRAAFGHGRTRNLLMERSAGAHVAFLTQDAVPAGDGWRAALLGGFELAGDVALVSGRYLARPDAPPWVRRELDAFFARLGPGARVDRERTDPVAAFHSSANGAVARRAWERVPFRDVAYAEDQRLALDLLAAGYAKAYVPDAAVVHSHDYPGFGWLGRVFDEFAALHAVHGLREPLSPRFVLARIRNDVAAERAALARDGLRGRALDAATLGALRYHAQRALGRSLGTNADRLPGALRERLSHEARARRRRAGAAPTGAPPPERAR